MSFDWDHSFCLTCDKQTDGTTYCSESCRLAEFEQASSSSSSTSSSPPSSPSIREFTNPWDISTSSSPPAKVNRLFLHPAFDFSNARNKPTTLPQARRSTYTTDATRALSTSSSNSSLNSMRSTSSVPRPAPEPAYQLSEMARKELFAYANSFESRRTQRRRSH